QPPPVGQQHLVAVRLDPVDLAVDQVHSVRDEPLARLDHLVGRVGAERDEQIPRLMKWRSLWSTTVMSQSARSRRWRSLLTTIVPVVPAPRTSSRLITSAPYRSPIPPRVCGRRRAP